MPVDFKAAIANAVDYASEYINDVYDDVVGLTLPDEVADLVPGAVKVSNRTTLQYPIVDDHLYKAVVVFTQIEESVSDINKVGDVVNQNDNSPVDDTGENDTVVPNTETLGGLLGSQIGAQAADKIKTVDVINPSQRCILYLPQSLNIGDNMDYGSEDLFRVGAAASNAIAGGGNSLGSLSSAFVSELGTLIKGIAQNGTETGKYLAVKMSSALSDGNIQGAVREGLRITLNPNTRMLFNHPNLRSFNFNFTMIAKSKDEAEQIKRIIKYFRSRMYPEQIPIGNISVLYRFPDKFHIKFLYKDEQSEGRYKEIATKVKPCYLRSCNVSYNPQSMSMHYDGNFEAIDMALEFVEAAALNRQDVLNGGY